MSITLRQIEIFLNVVSVGHLTSVSKDMGLSQSAVSMSIKELETTLSKQLFDRISKRLILNEVGRAFYEEIKPLYKKIIDVQNEFQFSPNKGIIRVGASTTIVDYMMPTIICNYMSEYPDVKISLKEGNTKDIIEMIKDGHIDIGFVEGSVIDSEVVKEIIGVDELLVVASTDKFNAPCNMSDLCELKWVLREKGSGTREMFLEYIKDKCNNLNIFLELGHTESIKSVLRSSDTLACISQIAVEKDIKDGTLHRANIKKFECKRDLYMIHHKDKLRSELFDKFTFFAKKMIKTILDEKRD